MTLTPLASIGVILPDGLATGWPSAPIIMGMLGPVMSASSSPTEAPALASATARLTLIVVFPTPPLPEATATMFLTPGSICGSEGVDRRTVAPHSTSIRSAPIGRRAASTRAWISSLSGQAGVVNSIVNDTLAPSMTRSSDHVPRDQVAPELGFLDRGEGL